MHVAPRLTVQDEIHCRGIDVEHHQSPWSIGNFRVTKECGDRDAFAVGRNRGKRINAALAKLCSRQCAVELQDRLSVCSVHVDTLECQRAPPVSVSSTK